MKALARKTLRGRRGQALAVAVTLAFAATVVGAFGLLLETGARGVVATGEYAAPPLVVGAPQTLAVAEDADAAVTGRASLPAALAEELRAIGPSTRVEVDRVVPAVLVHADGTAEPVSAHPWSAFSLGDRDLAAGRGPRTGTEVVLPVRTAYARGVAIGDDVELGFGDRARRYTLVGTTDADDTGSDHPDAYLTDGEVSRRTALPDRVAAIGVWPAGDDAEAQVRRVVEAHGARVWAAGERGGLEVVDQWSGRQTLISIGGAAGAMAFIVATFTIVAIVALQVRERSGELALLRVLGATPKQVKRLLRSEVRRVAVVAAMVGSALGPLLGLLMLRGVVAAGIASDSLRPVVGPVPVVLAIAVSVVAAEMAARVAVRRVAKAPPLRLARGDDTGARSGLSVGRALAGVVVLGVGAVMVAAPWYGNGEVAWGLPPLSGLVLAIGVALLSPAVVAVLVGARRFGARSPEAHLAFASMTERAPRVAGALSPLVLGVSFACIQLFPPTTLAAIGEDQAHAGGRADLTVTSTGTGIGADTIEALRDLPEVAAVEPVVSTSVNVLGPAEDATWQALPALGVDAAPVTYADLGPRGGAGVTLRAGEVALGSYGADLLAVDAGARITLVRPDGSTADRRVAAVFERDLGFGQVVVPIDDLRPATDSGRATGVSIRLAHDASRVVAADAVAGLLRDRPGLSVGTSPVVADAEVAAGEGALRLLLLAVLAGYIAIAVANSVVVTTLARRREFFVLGVIGTTPHQLRRMARVEGLFLAAAACVLGTGIAVPGLATMTAALSHGEMVVPSIAPATYAGIVAITFALALGATAVSARLTMRTPGAGRSRPVGRGDAG